FLVSALIGTTLRKAKQAIAWSSAQVAVTGVSRQMAAVTGVGCRCFTRFASGHICMQFLFHELWRVPRESQPLNFLGAQNGSRIERVPIQRASQIEQSQAVSVSHS